MSMESLPNELDDIVLHPMEPEVLEILEVPPLVDMKVHEKFRHFRNLSEVKREAKGGYLSMTIQLSQDLLNSGRKFSLRLDLTPGRLEDQNPFDIHPNMLHLKMCKLNILCCSLAHQARITRRVRPSRK